MLQKTWSSGIRLVFVWPLVTALPAVAATSFSNSLTGFTGDSTQPATQAALAAAGFNFFSTDSGPAVVFDANGAKFGSVTSGDDGRNFMRTNDSDYANFSSVSEVTLVVPNLDNFDEATNTGPPYQSGWLGMGTGDAGFFGFPDWGTQFSSVNVVPEKFSGSRFYTTMYTTNDSPVFSNNNFPALDNGTHRLRLSSFNELAVFSIDLNYAGGAFVEDFRAPAVNVSSLYSADGWPSEPSRIYFGGDDGTIFKNFQVAVAGPQGRFGDLNSDGNINSLDWSVLRTNLESDLSSLGLTLKNQFARGDLNLDNQVNYADFNAFQIVYDQANGAGSFANLLASVPEPATVVLCLVAWLFMFSTLPRAIKRG
jgi:hypothetical protein